MGSKTYASRPHFLALAFALPFAFLLLLAFSLLGLFGSGTGSCNKLSSRNNHALAANLTASFRPSTFTFRRSVLDGQAICKVGGFVWVLEPFRVPTSSLSPLPSRPWSTSSHRSSSTKQEDGLMLRSPRHLRLLNAFLELRDLPDMDFVRGSQGYMLATPRYVICYQDTAVWPPLYCQSRL